MTQKEDEFDSAEVEFVEVEFAMNELTERRSAVGCASNARHSAAPLRTNFHSQTWHIASEKNYKSR